MPAYELTLVARKTNYSLLLKKYALAVLDAGGVVKSIESLGTRRLAYTMFAQQQKHMTGKYLVLRFESPASLPKEMDRRLKIDDDVVRHLLVRQEGMWAALEGLPVSAAHLPDGMQKSSLGEQQQPLSGPGGI